MKGSVLFTAFCSGCWFYYSFLNVFLFSFEEDGDLKKDDFSEAVYLYCFGAYVI
jgi:hypothetical protein